jgi:hypothetical protein
MTTRTNSKSPGRQKNGANAALPKKKLASPQEEQSQPKDTTSSKDLFVGLLALFLYFTVKMNGLIVAIGLVAYFFRKNSNKQEIANNNQKEDHDNYSSVTPFCIEDAQYAKPSQLITANKVGGLNEKRRKSWHEICMYCKGYKPNNGKCNCRSKLDTRQNYSDEYYLPSMFLGDMGDQPL